MRLTISAIGAEIGSIAGLAPSGRLLAAIHSTLHPAKHRSLESDPLIIDYHVNYTGDTVTVLLTHRHGPNDPRIRELASAAIGEAAGIAVEQGLCEAGKCFDRRPLEFAEMVFEERSGEGFLLFTAEYIDSRVFAPVLHRASAAGCAVSAAGPILLIRTGGELLDSRTVLAEFAGGRTPVMPVPLNTPATSVEGPTMVSCAAFSMHGGKLTEPVDCFAAPFWDALRDEAMQAVRTRSPEHPAIRTAELAPK